MPSIERAHAMPNAPRGHFVKDDAPAKWNDIVAHSRDSAVLIDLDGTLASEVQGYTMPDVHPDYPEVFGQLSEMMDVAAVTGREDLAIEWVYGIGDPRVHRISEYGCGHSYNGEYTEWVPRPGGLDSFNLALDIFLEEISADDKVVTQKKPHMTGVHYQDVSDAAAEKLVNYVEKLAGDHDLTLRQSKGWMEVGPKVDKGNAIWRFFHERGTKPFGVVFLGNSSGDRPAQETLRVLETWGVVAVFVCVGNDDRDLAERADIHLDGPDEPRKLLKWLHDGEGQMMAS